MPLEPLRLVWKKRSIESSPRQPQPPINDPKPPGIYQHQIPSASSGMGAIRCVGRCKAPKRQRVQNHPARVENPMFPEFSDQEELVLEKFPLCSLMTARVVSTTWNARLAHYMPRLPASMVLVPVTDSNQLVAFDIRHNIWARLPESCCLPSASSSVMAVAGGGLVAISCGVWSGGICSARLQVGSLLAGVWEDVALPPLCHEGHSRIYALTRDTDSPTSFQLISLLGKDMGPLLVYDSRQQSWSPRVWQPGFRRKKSAGLLVFGNRLYVMGIIYDDMGQDVGLVLVESSLATGGQMVEMLTRWPTERPYLGCTFKLLQCGGVIYAFGTECLLPFEDFSDLAPPYTLVIWHLVHDEWVVEAKCPMQATWGDCCSDGVDTLWLLVSAVSGSTEILSYKLSTKSWSSSHPCPFNFKHDSCFYLDDARGLRFGLEALQHQNEPHNYRNLEPRENIN